MEYIFLFITGSAIGSFLNVVIDRIPRGENLTTSRSKCEKCSKILQWYDLIPLLSFIVLGGRCRYCHVLIPARLFLIELGTGAIFVILYYYFNLYSSLSWDFILALIAVSALIAIFFTDIFNEIIPDEMLVVLTGLGLVKNVILDSSLFLPHVLTGIVSFGFFLLLYVFTKGRGMGLGDVKFAFVIGFLLGFPNTLVAFYAAFLTGAFISIILVISGKKKLRGSTIPFGPFLVTGFMIAYIFGKKIVENIYIFELIR